MAKIWLASIGALNQVCPWATQLPSCWPGTYMSLVEKTKDIQRTHRVAHL